MGFDNQTQLYHRNNVYKNIGKKKLGR